MEAKDLNTKNFSNFDMATVVTRSGQITLEMEIRKKLGIEVGTPLEINRIGEIIMIEKKSVDFWDRCGGTLPKDFEKSLKKIRTDSRKRFKRLGLT